MSVTSVAAAGTALALYYYGRRGSGVCGPGEAPVERETHTSVHSAPTTFMEDLFFLAEGLRYTYGETLGRWRTADLLIGLAYLCRKDPEEHPVTDIALQGRPFGQGLTPEQWPQALAELRELERFFRYCSGLRERRPLPQRRYFQTVLDVSEEDLLMQELRAGVLKPSFVLIRDRQLRTVVLAIRGTHSFKDMFTSLTGASKPHHLVDANGVVLGYSHFGMLAAARWIKGQTGLRMVQALADNPGFRLRIIGHSLGGGTAALLTMMLREEGGPFTGVTCVAIACPSCMTLELAQSCSDYVTTVVHNCDVIPTICPGSSDTLREEMMRRRAPWPGLGSWFGEFRRDVRASGIVRAVETGLRGVGSATLTATSWTTSQLAACYRRGPFVGATQRRQHHKLKRRNSDDSLAASAAAEEAAGGAGGDEEGPGGGSPLSSSAPAGSGFDLLAAGEEAEAAAAAAAAGGGWGQALSMQLSGRSAAVLSSTTQALRSTGGVIRSTSGKLLRRVWPPVAEGGADGAADAAPAAGAFATAAVDAPPEPADAAPGPADAAPEEEAMVVEEAEEVEEALELLSEDEGEAGRHCGSTGAGYVRRRQERRLRVQLELERSGSLEEEVSLRMHEVRQAVHDAEAEEAAAGRGDSTVPAVIRPGGYGIGGTASSPRISPSKRDPRWKRQMYPAGRILHLVPARLVPGTAAHAAAAAAAAQAAAEAAAREDGQQGAEAGVEACAAGGSGDAATLPPAGPPAGGGPKHAARLSVGDLMAGEGLLGQRSGAGWAGAPAAAAGEPQPAREAQGPQQPEGQQPPAAQPQQQAEEMLLLDQVPQQAYARIKLCRTVLSDHVIPNYLKSLESALAHIQTHAQAVPVSLGAAAAEGAPLTREPADGKQPAVPAQAAATQQPAAAGAAARPPPASPAAAAAAAALRGAAAKASFGRSAKQD